VLLSRPGSAWSPLMWTLRDNLLALGRRWEVSARRRRPELAHQLRTAVAWAATESRMRFAKVNPRWRSPSENMRGAKTS